MGHGGAVVCKEVLWDIEGVEGCSGVWGGAEGVLRMVTGDRERHGDIKGAKGEWRGVQWGMQDRNVIEEEECVEQESHSERAQKRNAMEWHIGVWN